MSARCFALEGLLRWWQLVHADRYALPDVLWAVPGGPFAVLPAPSADGVWHSLFIDFRPKPSPEVRTWLAARGYAYAQCANLEAAVAAVHKHLQP